MGKQAYFAVRDGMLEVKINNGDLVHTKGETIEPLNTDALVWWIEENNVSDVMFSSSCDWPEDGGLPKNTDIRGWIDEAFYIIEEKQKAISRKKLRNEIGSILDKHFQAHPQKIETAVDQLMELTVL